MRLATFRDEMGTRIGVLRDGKLLDLSRAATLSGEEPPAELRDMLALIDGGEAALQRVASLASASLAEAEIALDAVELLAPIPRPRKNLLCVGRNYAEHAAESMRAIGQQGTLPTRPNVFTKAVTTVIGPHADVPFDARISAQIDWEVELAVILGRGGRHIARADALSHVFGYTVLNDVTARDLQHMPGLQWFQGKSIDGSCPMGPCILTADEVPDPQQLNLKLYINSELKQSDTTQSMLFDIATIIESLSSLMTLEPGEILATGTPSGVGFARTPPEFLRPGDLMQSEIEGIGTLLNRIVDVRQGS